ncbi:MAG: hypothetical protein WDZ79_00070 [Candidatus Paceibacterota bacterium]
MKKAVIWILIILLVIVGIYWFMDRDVADEPVLDGESAAEVAESVTVTLSEQNDSGLSGKAVLTAQGASTQVELELDGAPQGVAQPAHIHTGSCADIGGVAYPLEFPVNGVSITAIDVALSDLLSDLPLAINVHQSPEEVEIYVACGDVEAE